MYQENEGYTEARVPDESEEYDGSDLLGGDCTDCKKMLPGGPCYRVDYDPKKALCCCAWEAREELKPLNSVIQICNTCGKVDVYKDDGHECDANAKQRRVL